MAQRTLTTPVGVRIFSRTVTVKPYRVGHRHPVFDVVATVEIDVDWILTQLGQKAAFNKSKKTKALNGAVIVRTEKP